MAAETGRPYDNLENVGTRRGNPGGVMKAALPAVIAALASIFGLFYDKYISNRLAEQRTQVDDVISTSRGNQDLLNQIIMQQILPYRDKVVELLGTINVELDRVSKSSKAKINENLVQALEQLRSRSEKKPYRWDKNVLQETKEYNDYVANAYAEISTGNASEEKKQNYYQEASNRRATLLEEIDRFISNLETDIKQRKAPVVDLTNEQVTSRSLHRLSDL